MKVVLNFPGTISLADQLILTTKFDTEISLIIFSLCCYWCLTAIRNVIVIRVAFFKVITVNSVLIRTLAWDCYCTFVFMILIALACFQIPLTRDNYKRVIKWQSVSNR